MGTYLEIIQDAYEDIGFLSKGRTLDGADEATALRSVQRILGMWSDAGWMTPTLVKRSFACVVGQNSYSIGASAADVSYARPTAIKGAFIRDASGTDYAVSIIDAESFRKLSDKSVSERPTSLFYLPSVPNGTLYFNSKPISVTDYLYYDAEEPFTEPTKASDTITMAPAYRHALLCRLKLDLAPKKHMAVEQDWILNWREARAVLTTRAAINRVTVSVPDLPTVSASYNILSDS